MLEVYAKEFVGIGSYMKKKNGSKKGFVLAEKTALVNMLNKNMYDTSDNKLKIWKSLKWIATEERRTTQRVYDQASKSYKPYVKMDEVMLDQLENLLKNQ